MKTVVFATTLLIFFYVAQVTHSKQHWKDDHTGMNVAFQVDQALLCNPSMLALQLFLLSLSCKAVSTNRSASHCKFMSE